MPIVEVFEGKDVEQLLCVAEFGFMPRIGELISRDTEGYFRYYNVVEVWHRQVGAKSSFVACVRVEEDS